MLISRETKIAHLGSCHRKPYGLRKSFGKHRPEIFGTSTFSQTMFKQPPRQDSVGYFKSVHVYQQLIPATCRCCGTHRFAQ